MTDKIGIINDCLGLTGNRLCAAADDGSDEWNVASIAYEAAVGWLIEAHSWNFGTSIVTANRVGDSPDNQYDDAYAKPNGTFRIVWVRLNDAPVDYKIVGGQILLSANGGVVTVKIVQQPTPDSWPPFFLQALRASVMEGIYRGLNEDIGSADKQASNAQAWLSMARTTTDQDQPKRSLFNSRLRTTRRVRRPWSSSPRDWGGGGNPGT